jgi:NADH:ubiquinone reductase (non-electrogenic)
MFQELRPHQAIGASGAAASRQATTAAATEAAWHAALLLPKVQYPGFTTSPGLGSRSPILAADTAAGSGLEGPTARAAELNRTTTAPGAEQQKPRVVILGTGFGAAGVLREIDHEACDVTIISPRNHFLFTPLLASSAVGTIELQSILEPVRDVLRGHGRFLQGLAEQINPERKVVTCRPVNGEHTVEVPFDRLIVAIGAVNNTWGIPGVVEHCHFLKDGTDARTIRNSVIDRLDRAAAGDLPPGERLRILHFTIIGGGPTGVEFAGELSDFISSAVRKRYPELRGEVRISLIEASSGILAGYDDSLRDYAIAALRRHGVEVRLDTSVVEVTPTSVKLRDGTDIPSGLTVWSSGVKPPERLAHWGLPVDARGRLIVSPSLQVDGHPDIFALGDCAAVQGHPLPTTAQVALQEGTYLGRALNQRSYGVTPPPFEFHDQGRMAYVGGGDAVVDLPGGKVKGVLGKLLWCSVYLARLPSLRSRTSVVLDWCRSRLFGRDTSTY